MKQHAEENPSLATRHNVMGVNQSDFPVYGKKSIFYGIHTGILQERKRTTYAIMPSSSITAFISHPATPGLPLVLLRQYLHLQNLELILPISHVFGL